MNGAQAEALRIPSEDRIETGLRVAHRTLRPLLVGL
jgi:hypothetical protein